MEKVHIPFLVIGLFAFLALFYGPWQTMCVDWARQLMFEARDRLFDAAASGDIAFDSKEYRKSRETFEGMIRFCHIFTWPRLILLWISIPISKEEDNFNLKDLSPKIREAIGQSYIQVLIALVLCIMGRSIVLAPLFLLIYFGGVIATSRFAHTLFAIVKKDVDELDRADNLARISPRGRG